MIIINLIISPLVVQNTMDGYHNLQGLTSYIGIARTIHPS